MKKIGILTWKLGDNSFGVTTPYLEWLDMFGSIRLLDYAEEFDGSLDLLVIPGGPDIDPNRYGEKPGRQTGKSCPYREYFEQHVLPIYIDNFVPILGVCRGHQAIAVAMGGTLYQHLQHETSTKSRWELVHDIYYKIQEGNKIVEKQESVNSIHHQVVKNPGNDMKVIARYRSKTVKSGVIEAIMHRELPIVGIQAHPEEILFSKFANGIVTDLLKGLDNNKYVEV